MLVHGCNGQLSFLWCYTPYTRWIFHASRLINLQDCFHILWAAGIYMHVLPGITPLHRYKATILHVLIHMHLYMYTHASHQPHCHFQLTCTACKYLSMLSFSMIHMVIKCTYATVNRDSRRGLTMWYIFVIKHCSEVYILFNTTISGGKVKYSMCACNV